MKEKLNDEDEKKYLAMLAEIREYGTQQFDKLIVFFSCGALILTTIFTDKILYLSKLDNFLLLCFSWGSFISSLIFILISHRASVASIDFYIENKLKRSDFWRDITDCLNWLSVSFFVLGIIFFIMYGIVS